MKRLFCLVFFVATLSLSAYEGYKRDFNAPTTDSEKTNIGYIVNTLAKTSTFKLLFYKSSLEKSGASVKHVHPLKFLEVILKNPELRQSVRKIRGMAWNSFSKGLQKSLSKAAYRKNLEPSYVDQFAKVVGVSKEQIMPYFQNQNWKGFLDVVLQH